MKCTCCGKEISSSDRYCSNCGQNNDSFIETFVEPPEDKKINEHQYIPKTKPIESGNVYNNSNNQSYSNLNKHEKKMAREIVAYVLFALTVIALISQAITGFKLFANSSYPLATIIGFFTPAIIGIILIISAKKHK